MATVDAPSVADSQRNRAFRKEQARTQGRGVEPPRQRRSGLAALAVLLIVGGALLAGLLAVRMDSREPVLAAARDIAPGSLLQPEDLREVSVASEGLRLIPADLARQVLDGDTYARVAIRKDSLVDENMLTRDAPVSGDRAIVAVPLNPSITPADELRGGDLVQVVRIGAKSGETAVVLTEGLVLSVSRASGDDLGGSSSGAANLLVPKSQASAVVDAAGADAAGLALVERGLALDAQLRGAE